MSMSFSEEQNTKTAKEIQKCEKIMIGEPEFSLKKITCKRYIKKLCKISRNGNNELNRFEKLYLKLFHDQLSLIIILFNSFKYFGIK